MQKVGWGERLRQFEAPCRAEGVPLTVQRQDIFKEVPEQANHPAAGDV